MTIRILPALMAVCALTIAGPVYAQRGHAPKPPAPKAPTTHVQGGAAHGTQTHGSTMHGGGSHGTMTSPKTTTHGPSTHGSTKGTTVKGSSGHKTTTATTVSKTGKKSTTTSSKNTSKTTAPTTTATTTTTTSGTQLTPLQQKLQKNTNLAAKLQSRLPAGMRVQDACLGFRNLGQFVAAVNVSNNLGIRFSALKAKMTGDTPMSLGQAIHALRPTVDADTESRTAQRQADALISGRR